MEKATFGAGCFWGVEENFANLEGVTATKVGYSGGTLANATYKDVCGGQTGHAEVVEVTFDPSVLSYKDLVNFFFTIHDPTTINRQGPDHGDQYRSAIFFHSPEQQTTASEVIETLQKESRFRSSPIVTQVAEAKPFYDAEEYHQKYLAKQGLKVCH
jgi:peptide-methionine (S)-S-oxide reductase